MAKVDVIDGIIGYENGELDEAETIELFQTLVDNGMAWSLQGHYGRTAARMIQDGLIEARRTEPEKEAIL